MSDFIGFISCKTVCNVNFIYINVCNTERAKERLSLVSMLCVLEKLIGIQYELL